MKLYLTVAEALDWTRRLLAVYVMIDSLEKLYTAKEYSGNGIFSWDLLRKNNFFMRRPAFVHSILDVIFSMPVWMGLIILRLFCGVYLLGFPSSPAALICCFSVLFFAGSLMNFRNIAYGAETENRFSLILIGALLLQKIVPTYTVTIVAFWFIALQVCLSYTTAGVAKLFNKNWMRGNGFLSVANSYELMPLKGVSSFFGRHPGASKVINWWVIAVECFSPVVLIVGRPYFWWMLALGILFHVSIAIWLRLGKFFWVWIAAYPALIFITQ